MEDRPFFNPYGFNNIPPNVSLPPNVSFPPNVSPNPIFAPSPLEFYNNQYYYYRYLNEYLDYSIKSAEYEKKIGIQNGLNSNLKG